MPDGSALNWPVATLLASFERRELSPVEVAREALERIAAFDATLHAFLAVDPELTLAQATEAEAAYRRGQRRPLLGVPVSVKDTFYVRGLPTTLGSLLSQDGLAAADSGAVRRLRDAGAVFTGKTNTAEFGQSATTENRLGPGTVNPWDVKRTPGGSSGGAAASVAAGLSTLALGSDGGGSIRIPAAFCGLFSLKPTRGRCRDEDGFRAMTDFVSPGPLAWSAVDARPMLGVLAGRGYPRRPVRPLVVGYDARPEGRPVDPGIAAHVDTVARTLERLGHRITPIDLPLAGWNDVFGPLVLEDEGRERGHLLETPDLLSDYERRSLEAAAALAPSAIEAARRELPLYRQRLSDVFLDVDVVLTPATAVPAFELGRRPREIGGTPVDGLWGAFPFAVPFNVAGTPAASIPCGLVDGLPVAAQLVTPPHTEALLLDLAEVLDEAVDFDRNAVQRRWTLPALRAAEVGR